MPSAHSSGAKPLRAPRTRLGRSHAPQTAKAVVPTSSLTTSRRDIPRATSRASRSNQLAFMLEWPRNAERLLGFDTGTHGLFPQPDTLPPKFAGRVWIRGGQGLGQLFEGLIGFQERLGRQVPRTRTCRPPATHSEDS